jgi:hypothetical protein
MTVRELRKLCDSASPDAEVLARLDSESIENHNGLVFEILGGDYSYGCTETPSLMLDCGQPDE